MATYIFKCKNCKTEFEVSISPSLVSVFKTVCPDCKSKNVVRVYTSIPYIFKDNKK